MSVGYISETGYAEQERILKDDARSLAISSYDIGKYFYQWCPSFRNWPGPVHNINEIGCVCWYACKEPSRKRKTKVKIAEMVPKWKRVVVGLATAHSKDEADRLEASVEELLTPLLTAPVAQIRQFSALLLMELKNDPAVPYLVWKAYEVWVDQMEKAPDGEVKGLKEDLARQIVEMVEQDAKEQLPDAMIRALMWRSPERLEEVKTVVEQEKAAGRGVRLKGRESCLFLEAGGSEDEPKVCIQI